jgi:hypothetical protein
MDGGSRQAANGNTLSPATVWQFTGSSSAIIMPVAGVMRQGKQGRAGIYPPSRGAVFRLRHDPAGLR